MPYICMSRDDVADGTIQVLDLFPNSSQRNLIYDGEGQTRYINRANSSTVTNILDNTGAETDAVCGATIGDDAVGLGAYLADTLDNGGSVLTTAEISAAVVAVLNLVDTAATLAASAVATATGHTQSANFSVENLLKVLAGAHYKIDKGTTLVVDSSQGAFVFQSKDTNLSYADTVTKSYDGEEFQLSINSGHLATFTSSIALYGSQSASDSATGYPVRQHPSVKNRNAKTAASARIVVIYNDDGSVLA